jgi:hypothetical protein
VKHFRRIEPIAYILGFAGGVLFIVLLIREGAEPFKIGKLDAARRQLVTAIRIYFADGDCVSSTL